MLKRRPFLVVLPLASAGPVFAIDPFSLTILTTLISAGAAVWSAKAAAQIAVDGQLRALELQWSFEQAKLQAAAYANPAYPIGDKPVRQQTAYGRDGTPMSIGWTDDLDGAGTYAGLAGGRLGFSRAQYSGVITSAEAERFSEGVRHGEAMAIPVEGGYHTFSPQDADRIQTALGSNFRSGDSLVGGRHFSRASRPTASGWDLESVMVANNKGNVRALAVNRNALQA